MVLDRIINCGWAAATGENKLLACEIVNGRLVNAIGNNRVNKKCATANNHAGMVHGIAQLAFFRNNLFGLVMTYNVTAACFYQLMLMNVHHILACNKADQQYPRLDNMAFIIFHVSSYF